MNDLTKVAVRKCADYGEGVEAAMQALLADLGGMGRFVRVGQNVLIKPNLLSDREPDEAVTTHPAVVRAIIRLVRKAGGRPSVGDSPASAVKLAQVWERTGMRALCADEDVPLLNLEKAGSRPFTANGAQFNIAQPVLDADVLINVPKIKTHAFSILTAGVKNLYGAVPGFQKTHLHKLHPRPSDFGHMLVGILATVKPALTIADGIVAMEGEGPAAGKPYPLGILAASANPAALDVVLCRVLGIDPLAVAYLRELIEADRAQSVFERIEVRGDSVGEVQARGFRTPSNLPARMIPRSLARVLGPLVWIRPAISESCIKCGRCVKACPKQALSASDGERPALNPRLCIGCCCCHEVCPVGAISMVQSPLLKLVCGGKMP